MGKRYTRVHRLLRLIILLQAHRGMNIRDLARVCEMSQRTLYRDIDTLCASGVPVFYDEQTEGYQLGREFFMPPVDLTPEEAFAVVSVLEEVAGRKQIPFMDAAGRAIEKIRSHFPLRVLEDLQASCGRVKVSLAAGMVDETPQDVYQKVRQAIGDKCILHCIYEPNKADGQQQEFNFRPYALWYCQRAWYAIGEHDGRRAVRQLKLNRFVAMRVTGDKFVIPKNFDLHENLGLAWRMIRGATRHEVAIRFLPTFAETVCETFWHSTQQEQWLEDGSAIVRFTVDGLDEILWWVLGYGPGAQVIEPAELRDRVAEMATQVVQYYAGNDAAIPAKRRQPSATRKSPSKGKSPTTVKTTAKGKSLTKVQPPSKA